jgi:hypothetical protein
MQLASKSHTAGDTKRWTVKYEKYLANSATIESIEVTSNSLTCLVQAMPTILGSDVVFFLSGGTIGEKLTVALVMTDSLGNVKNDTIKFVVVAP